jgi:hypothetical protein
MTHRQLVEEWKEKLKRDFDFLTEFQLELLSSFLGRAMFLAADGAAEATNCNSREWNPIPHNELRIQGWNAAVTQSSKQLKEYFAE